MLNIPSQSFPAPISQQRVSSSVGRSKVPLKPGRSLMDWIRLTKSGADLTGVKGKLIEVTEEELANHNKKDDCWVCIRGLVYNVSPYMEYHPGGVEELMKAAGSDGTDLFDQVHRWVNYESMLKECLVGRMAVKPLSVAKGMPIAKKVPVPLFKEVMPRYDWFQTDTNITVIIYTKEKVLTRGSVIADLQGGVLSTEVILGESSYLLHIRLSHEVEEDVSVQTSCGVGKVELGMKKKSSTKWKELGLPLDSHDLLLKSKDRGLFYRKCTLVSITDVTHDTKLYCLQLPHGTSFQVPIGKHVYLKSVIKGSEIVKPYTPVFRRLIPEQEVTDFDSKNIFLMIKIYPDGALTSHIGNLQLGDSLYASNPEGQFSTSRLQGVTTLYLLAAGTGFTPMTKLIQYALKDLDGLRRTRLLFFNRSEKDILWMSQLQQVAEEDNRFEVEHVLSEPSLEWTGKRGRIELSLVSDFMNKSTDDSKTLVCVCGPSPFTEQALTILQKLGFSEEEIHAFLG